MNAADAMRQLCDEISDLVTDIRVLRADALFDLWATARTFKPTTPPTVPTPPVPPAHPTEATDPAGAAGVVFELESAEERAMREQGELLLADALAAESDARWLAGREADAAANAGGMSRADIAAEYAAHVERQYLAAETYCRGVLLTRAAAAAGVHPRTLFTGPSHVAHARASEELRRFWADVDPRMTLAEFTAHLTGRWTDAAETARHAAYNAWRAA
jgi:hypothetical protein